jgi:hypothetical protein
MPTIRRLIAVLSGVVMLGTGLASPARAGEAQPEIGSVCHPERTQPASRTVDFWVQNQTSKSFLLIKSHLNHGVWDGTAPPVRIGPREWVCWRSKSSGVATGTQGWATYFIEGKNMNDVAFRWTLTWNNPWWGDNTFECRQPAAHSCHGWPGSGGGSHPTPIFQMDSNVPE